MFDQLLSTGLDPATGEIINDIDCYKILICVAITVVIICILKFINEDSYTTNDNNVESEICERKAQDELILDLHYAANKCLRGIEYIDMCKNIIYIKPSLINKSIPPYGYTPFLRACMYGCTELIVFMLQNGANVNISNIHGDTPIYLASYAMITNNTKNFDALNTLMKAGCSLNIARRNGYTTMHLAARFGHDSLVQWLLRNGADLTPAGCELTPYAIALKYGNLDTAALLYEEIL